MTTGWKWAVSAGVVLLWLSAAYAAENTSAGEAATRDRRIEDMKNAFDEITESFRQRVLDLEKAGAVARDEAIAERDTAIAERDAALARIEMLETSKEAMEEKIRELSQELSGLRTGSDAVRADAAARDAEIARLQAALTASQAVNSRERFALAYNLGNIYRAARQYARAEAEYLKALEMKPDDSALHFNMGILYDDNLGDRKKARYHYERFLDLAPNDSDAPNVVKWLKELDLK